MARIPRVALIVEMSGIYGRQILQGIARLSVSRCLLQRRQLQLNALIIETLRDAKQHPERHNNGSVPLIPGVTDSDENLTAIAEAVRGSLNLVRVDLLPYNRAAGGKYAPCGMKLSPTYDESRDVNANTSIFSSRGIPASIDGL